MYLLLNAAPNAGFLFERWTLNDRFKRNKYVYTYFFNKSSLYIPIRIYVCTYTYICTFKLANNKKQEQGDIF